MSERQVELMQRCTLQKNPITFPAVEVIWPAYQWTQMRSIPRWLQLELCRRSGSIGRREQILQSVTQASGDYSFWWRGGEFPASNQELRAHTSITDCCVTKELIHRCAAELSRDIQTPHDPGQQPKIPQLLHLKGHYKVINTLIGGVE